MGRPYIAEMTKDAAQSRKAQDRWTFYKAIIL
jgi:hypothetical protein